MGESSLPGDSVGQPVSAELQKSDYSRIEVIVLSTGGEVEQVIVAAPLLSAFGNRTDEQQCSA
jgi:hypothetical protein